MENFKRVSDSATIITELMIPSYSNFGGKVHGGILLSLMDKAAYACSAKHAGTYCVTASIDGVDFLAPAEVGELLSIYASVNYVGRSSLVIGMRVVSENVKTRTIKHTNTCYFTMVAMDDDHKTIEVPGLILETEEEVRRFFQGLHRRELNKYYKKEKDQMKTDYEKKEVMEILMKEKCKIILPGLVERKHQS